MALSNFMFNLFCFLSIISDIDLWPVVIKRCKLNQKACRKQRLLDTKYKDLRTNLCLQEKNCLLIFLQKADCERIFEPNFLDIVAEIKRKKPPENRVLSREKSRAIGTLHYYYILVCRNKCLWFIGAILWTCNFLYLLNKQHHYLKKKNKN